MRVFILTTGRSGSLTFIKACEHIRNFTSGHESLANRFGQSRFDYSDNHIEADNRLSWHLGQLNKLYGDTAFYVHLKRNRNQVALSYSKRYYYGSIVDAFCEGIRMTAPELMTDEERLQACFDYVDTVTLNIEDFLQNKTQKLTIDLENLEAGFIEFWKRIGAEGNLEDALKDIRTSHNPSSKRKIGFLSRMRILFIREYRNILMGIKS